MSCLYRDYRRVEGFEDYIISNYGEVFSTKSWHGKESREMKYCVQNNGYLQVNLWNNNISKKFTVHSLVGNAFIGKRINGLTFDHIDRNRTNNRR